MYRGLCPVDRSGEKIVLCHENKIYSAIGVDKYCFFLDFLFLELSR